MGSALAAIGMNSLPSRRKRRKRDGAGQTVAVVAIGALLAAGLFATGKYVVMQQRAPAPVRIAAAVPAVTGAKARTAAASSDDEIYTGSILYMPFEGRTCRQLLFNNLSGRFTDNGYVDCVRAAYQGEDGLPKMWSTARARVISSAFRQR
jgi:hypothetical protein